MQSNKKKRFSMDEVMVSLENDTKSEIEKNTEKIGELIEHIKILNGLVAQLVSNKVESSSHQTSYIS